MLSNIAPLTGPQDPSQFNATLNQIIAAINSGVGGIIATALTSTGTTAVTTEETLQSVQAPAGMLGTVGQIASMRATGSFAANANNKTVKLKFGAIVISSGVVATNNKNWTMNLSVQNTGVGTQRYWGSFTSDGVAATTFNGTGTVDMTAAVTCSVTGQNGTASANDIVCSGLTLEVQK